MSSRAVTGVDEGGVVVARVDVASPATTEEEREKSRWSQEEPKEVLTGEPTSKSALNNENLHHDGVTGRRKIAQLICIIRVFTPCSDQIGAAV